MIREFSQIIHDLAPAHTVKDSAPSTMAELVEYSGRIIWAGGTDTSVFDPATNWAFRAWHDAHHLTTGGDFSRAGELIAFESQRAELSSVGGDALIPLLHCEIVGQFEHFEKFGEFVQDQTKFTALYLRDPAQALKQRS